jgi:CTP-dependent riboflavin kinase
MDLPGKTFRGVVVSGRGFGAKRMANPFLLQAVQRFTDLHLVPGTLNVRLPQPFDGTLTGYLTEDDLGGDVWRDHAPHRQGIRYGEVLIAGRYRGILFQGDEPEYPPEQVEILSDQHLRTMLGLLDGDMLEFTLLTDQGTGRTP